jgi:hypothetical protein
MLLRLLAPRSSRKQSIYFASVSGVDKFASLPTAKRRVNERQAPTKSSGVLATPNKTSRCGVESRADA